MFLALLLQPDVPEQRKRERKRGESVPRTSECPSHRGGRLRCRERERLRGKGDRLEGEGEPDHPRTLNVQPIYPIKTGQIKTGFVKYATLVNSANSLFSRLIFGEFTIW